MKKVIALSFLFLIFSCDSKKHIVEFDDQGRRVEGVLKDGKKEGRWISFDSENDTTFVRVYKSGDLLVEYEYHNNVKWRKTELKDGVKHGDVISYYPSGEIECRGRFSQGKMVGKHICYFKDGTIDRIADYRDGSNPGEFVQYYSNGKVNIRTETMGNGVHQIFDSTGVLLYKVNFEDFKPKDTIYNRNIVSPLEGKNSN